MFGLFKKKEESKPSVPVKLLDLSKIQSMEDLQVLLRPIRMHIFSTADGLNGSRPFISSQEDITEWERELEKRGIIRVDNK